MSCKDNAPPCSLKCRYKAIEHFFRRIAFNLGNTPSQTEVKIISCIPVDVTDLQQRILFLEQQVREAEQNKNTFNTEFLTYPATVISNGFLKHHLGFASSIDDKFDKFSTNLNMVYPKTYEQRENCDSLKPQPVLDIDQLQKKRNCKKYHNVLAKNFSSHYDKDNGRNYCTFQDQYLNEMAQKQYRSSVIYESKDLVSSFSSPICRESSEPDSHELTLTSDANTYTSYFKNIDKKIEKSKYSYLQDTKQVYTMRNDIQYDMVPVKEKAEAKIIYKKKKINELYNNMQMTCSPNKNKRKTKMQHNLPSKYLDQIQQIKQTQSQSNSCYIDCGKIYPKKAIEMEKNISEYKELPSNEIDNSHQEIKPELKLNETEESLRQIKSILQTVLQEVKANSNDTRKDTHNSTDAKHVNVLKSTTNDNNSCYGNINSKNVAYSPCQPAANLYPILPIQPLQYLQPLMMQPPSYYPHCNHIKKNTGCKRQHLYTTGTNTDNLDETNESNKLIKEIYKSLNINLDSEGLQDKTSDLKNSKENMFKNDVQIYNTRPQKFTSKSEHSKKSSPKGILLNNSLNMIDKETEVNYDDETASMTESYVSEATTKTLATVTEKRKRNKSNFLTKFLKSFKVRKEKYVIPKKEIKFKEDVETIEDTNSESEEYSITSTEKRMMDYRYVQTPRRDIIKFEKKPKSIYRYYRNPFLEQEYREILADKHQFNTPKTPVYWHNYETRPVYLNDPVNFNKVNKPKYVKDKVIYSQANNIPADSNWLQKYKSNIQKCGQNWKTAVLES